MDLLPEAEHRITGVSTHVELSIKEIASRFAEQRGEDYERKITPHWIGHIVRRKLGLKTERYREGYVITAAEMSKLQRLPFPWHEAWSRYRNFQSHYVTYRLGRFRATGAGGCGVEGIARRS